MALGADSSVGEMEKIKLSKKPGEDRSQELLIGEVLPVGARRNMPAIHAGLPSVVPATAHALNTRSSPGLSALHSSHKGNCYVTLTIRTPASVFFKYIVAK